MTFEYLFVLHMGYLPPKKCDSLNIGTELFTAYNWICGHGFFQRVARTSASGTAVSGSGRKSLRG